MDRDQLRLKQKQLTSIQTDLEEKLKLTVEDRDRLSSELKEAISSHQVATSSLQSEHAIATD